MGTMQLLLADGFLAASFLVGVGSAAGTIRWPLGRFLLLSSGAQ
jgi:hypothetical protein